MKEQSPKEITLLATIIAVEIAEGKCLDELIELKHIIRQVLNTLDTIICEKGLKRFEHLEKKFKQEEKK